MVQIFAYFERILIVRKIEPTKLFARDDETTQFSLYKNFLFVSMLQMSLYIW